jgi:hypothetical protein
MKRYPTLAALAVIAIALWQHELHRALAEGPTDPPAAQTAPAQPRLPGPVPPQAEPPPGEQAAPEIVAEIRAALSEAVRRFQHGDVEGVLARVSDSYRTGPLTKSVLRQYLRRIVATNEELFARIRIIDVRMIGDRAWVYSTGTVTGRFKLLGRRVSLFSWEDAPEVAWREDGTWRLIGDQQQ